MFKDSPHATVGGMNYTDMVHYSLVSILFNQIRGGNLDFELVEMIRSGNLSNYLLRPVSVVEFVYLRGLAAKLVIAAFGITLGFGIGIWFGMSPDRLLWSMFLALLGNIIHYQLSATLATVAFYWEEAYSILMVKNILVQLLSGELIPLNLFPQSLHWIWKSTPFYLYVYGPAQFALGHWSYDYFFSQVAVATVWVILGSLMLKISWNLAIKKYLSLGG